MGTHEESWTKAKAALHSSKLLVHYSLERDIVIACDASPYRLSCVISHIMEDGTERPISYASHTLYPAEKNYSQLDKEAAAIMFGVRKFTHIFMEGDLKFTRITNLCLAFYNQTKLSLLRLLQEFNNGLCSWLVIRMN